MRLEEVHSSLFTEHKNLQEDYERIHIYVEVNILVLFVCLFVRAPVLLEVSHSFIGILPTIGLQALI